MEEEGRVDTQYEKAPFLLRHNWMEAGGREGARSGAGRSLQSLRQGPEPGLKCVGPAVNPALIVPARGWPFSVPQAK